MPRAIQMWEGEAAMAHADLDFAYIEKVAGEAAAIIATGETAEVNYQPGDWTRYGLFIVPLNNTTRASGKDEWGDSAIDGVERDGSWFLVVRVGGRGGAYPFQLGEGGWKGLVAGYVGSSLTDGNEVSGVSLAVLLRAVGWHLDRLRAVVA